MTNAGEAMRSQALFEKASALLFLSLLASDQRILGRQEFIESPLSEVEAMVKKPCCGLVGKGYEPVWAAGASGAISPTSGSEIGTAQIQQ
jgi:hypothetical protein